VVKRRFRFSGFAVRGGDYPGLLSDFACVVRSDPAGAGKHGNDSRNLDRAGYNTLYDSRFDIGICDTSTDHTGTISIPIHLNVGSHHRANHTESYSDTNDCSDPAADAYIGSNIDA
jgi:hypothetical protein